ncbi:hypothetical protein FRB98_004832 [Tulasnella sp. 332]|nr:hypothetical protein FRB98_004832 [Tulasnella sp. 332]
MSLWVDKYRPRTLEDLHYHKDLSERLRSLAASGDFPHMLFYGPSGSGKKTRIACTLRQLFGPGVEKLKIDQRVFMTPSKRKLDVNIVQSNFHIEITPSDVGIYDRVVIQEILKEIAQTQQVDLNAKQRFKVVIINEADSLSRDAQAALRRTMEKYMSNMRLILCANSTSKLIAPIKSRCLLMRVAGPEPEEMLAALNHVAKKERFDLPSEAATEIIEDSEGNMRKALLVLEALKTQSPDLSSDLTIAKPDWETYCMKVADLIVKEQSPAKVLEVRAKLYELLAHCIPPTTIIKTIAYCVVEATNEAIKADIMHWAAIYVTPHATAVDACRKVAREVPWDALRLGPLSLERLLCNYTAMSGQPTPVSPSTRLGSADNNTPPPTASQIARALRSPTTPTGSHARTTSDPWALRKKSTSKPLDVLAQLHKLGPGVVKTRQGSVLSRGFILKTDHYPSGRALEIDISLQGAPNFRQNRSAMNVYGVAQPRLAGLKAILSLLQCGPIAASQFQCHFISTREEPIVYISGSPFVLRDSSSPRESLTLTDRAENLEAIEKRLKADILAEAARLGGLILTHHELDNEDIIPTWTAVDDLVVKTPREVMDDLKAEGWSVEYHRIPIAQDRPIEDSYLDAYLNAIKDSDPLETPLVFSCGMGAVRTTFAMTAACIIRRKQLILRGAPDPYAHVRSTAPSGISSGISTPSALATLEQVNVQQELNKSLLRITYILQQAYLTALKGHDSRPAIQLLMTEPALLDSLRKAHQGTYSLILSLLGCLDHGTTDKKLVDRVLDDCDHITNLREEILVHRLRYALTSMDDKNRSLYLEKAVKSLEKYLFMIAFASYVDEHSQADVTFSDWMQARVEIWNQVRYLRKVEGLRVFSPVADLSVISKVEAARQHEVSVGGGRVLGDEWTDHVIKNRSGVVLRAGTLLKSDQWRTESTRVANGVRGAINFRNVGGTNVYCLGQPTEEAISAVLTRVMEQHPAAEQIVWITLREEPIVYVNGDPYCLRLEASSLRNMKDYGGISASRLEALEERLKGDVATELNAFDQRLLLHAEANDGTVIPVWEEVQPRHVAVLKEVMARQTLQNGISLQYHRIPITSEKPPDFTDISDLMDVVLRTGPTRGAAIVVNCQLGRGRSTLTSILIVLIQRWLQGAARNRSPSQPRRHHSRRSTFAELDHMEPPQGQRKQSYQVINNVLRVIRNGLTVKQAVDDAIDQCGEVFNLRDSIETLRISAEQASDPRSKHIFTQRGLQNLRRYFDLVIFQAYLQATVPDTVRTVETFEHYVKSRPVFKTFEKEMLAEGILSLKTLERKDVTEGVPLPDEIAQTVANRSGSVLSASTILKSDFFSNLQKMSLPERLEGAANFREVPLLLDLPQSLWAPIDGIDAKGKTVVGTGMPQTEGATGITTDVVESMEKALRRDVQREIQVNDQKILLHDEVEDGPGRFTITAQWENVDVHDAMTPREVFNMMEEEGYRVDYTRVAITDEQAPLPAALGQLVQRVKLALQDGDVIIQNCQMGRGRTTTGMVVSCLIATILSYNVTKWPGSITTEEEENGLEGFVFGEEDRSEEQAYMQGEYKTILQLVGVLSHGKVAKRLTDMAIDQMDGVQNLRKAVFDYKIKVDACEPKSTKQKKLLDLGVNYLFRYGTLIVLANYLIERRVYETKEDDFAVWLRAHREITTLLGRRNLD